jgi:hypothetical protein
MSRSGACTGRTFGVYGVQKSVISMKNRTYNRVSQTVSTTKKSLASR